MWDNGQVIVHHELWRGRVWAARPLTVVEDSDERALFWLPLGTRRKVPATPTSRPDPPTRSERIIENLFHGDWVCGEHTWDVSSLWIIRPGEWHATWISWTAAGNHLGWYINFQRPYRRTTAGFESMDLMLDIVVEPDLTWHWKDEEEFDEIARRRIFDGETTERVRREAAGVIRRIENREPPFNEPWPDWRPPTSWRVPVLPDDWERPV